MVVRLLLFALLSIASSNVITAAPTVSCRSAPVSSDALQFPSKHAWDLFIALVHPAMPIEIARGEPDCSKPLGAVGTTSVWETWRLARTEVFLPDGSEPPEWRDLSLPRGYLGAVPEPLQSMHTAALQSEPVRSQLSALMSSTPLFKPLFDPFPDNGVFDLSGGIGETHVNRATYDFIRDRCLFSVDGLKRYTKAFIEGKLPTVQFPTDSVEVKAVWLRFADVGGDKEIDKKNKSRYYVAKDDSGKEYGLTSFHILTKDTPNWFWANFHHIDNPKTPYEMPDTYGRPRELDGTIWGNYVLGGTQTDFVSPIGEKIALADWFIEYKFPPSSCMTCHSQANGSPDGSIGPTQIIAVGAPDPSAFMKDGKQFYMPTDFVWSIPFRARPETKAPPSRCK